MNKQTLKEWYELYRQFENGYHLSVHDWMELLRLNHELMEKTHNVHNESMRNR